MDAQFRRNPWWQEEEISTDLYVTIWSRSISRRQDGVRPKRNEDTVMWWTEQILSISSRDYPIAALRILTRRWSKKNYIAVGIGSISEIASVEKIFQK
jgi:hypothetical protein